MRIHFQDHAGFQRATLHVAVACSAVAAFSVVVGSERLRPGTAVLGAALATLALALGHLRVVVDPVADALARAAARADDAGRALLERARRAHATIGRAARREGASPSREGRAVAEAGTRATVALAELLRRRGELAAQLREAQPPDAGAELMALEARRDAACDDVARQTFARAAAALRERATRARGLEAVVERIDARLAAAAAELEGTAFAVATLAQLTPGDPPAALASACDRLRTASADLGAECDALAELGAT
jgi:hypothetical protein